MSDESSRARGRTPARTARPPARQHSAPDLQTPRGLSGGMSASGGRPGGLPGDDLVPTIFEWRGGGQTVCVRGGWDSHRHAIALDDNGDEHVALAYLPPGAWQFCYEVDGEARFAPHIPSVVDSAGRTVNHLLVSAMVWEFDTACGLHDDVPSSPLLSYGRPTLPDFLSDPPALPPHLEARSLKPLPEDISPSVRACAEVVVQPAQAGVVARPAAPGVDTACEPCATYRPFFSHVFIDHLYEARGMDDGVESVSQTFRFGSKVINTVFVSRRPPAAPPPPCVVHMPP